MLLGVDIDGVIADYASMFTEIGHRYCNGLIIDTSKYDFGLTREQIQHINRLMIRCHSFEHLELTPDGEYLISHTKPNDEIWYITKRNAYPESSRHFDGLLEYQTMTWLSKHKFPCAGNVIFTDDKIKVCWELDIKYLVEDNIDIVHSYKGVDLRIYLIDRPWNEGDYLRFGEYDYPFRVHNIKEVINNVER